MTMRGWMISLGVCAIGFGPIATAGDEPAPKTKRTKRAPAVEEESPYVDVEKKDLGENGVVGIHMKPSAECMSADDALKSKEKTRRAATDTLGIDSGPIEQSREIPECPAAIWTWVGQGHGARPVGNVQTPLTVATTRKRRRHMKHDCCYLVQQSPGSPNG